MPKHHIFKAGDEVTVHNYWLQEEGLPGSPVIVTTTSIQKVSRNGVWINDVRHQAEGDQIYGRFDKSITHNIGGRRGGI